MPDYLFYGFGLLPVLIWLYLLFGRGEFWQKGPFLDAITSDQLQNIDLSAKKVIAVIPARNEADVIAQSLSSLLTDQSQPISIILVDDQSDDGTADHAQSYLDQLPADQACRVTILRSAPRPAGWTGKLWAVHQGVTYVLSLPEQPEYILLTDADIHHGPNMVPALIHKADQEQRHLVSLMVKLACQSSMDRLLIPAFVFFFKLLYPFNWINNPQKSLGGAAGGCMLVRRDSLVAAGGIEAIKDALIDDCTLGQLMKGQGSIWLGLTQTTYSIRPYQDIWEIWRMVRRSAYTQLAYNPLLLLGTVVGMFITYLLPLIYLAYGSLSLDIAAMILGGAAWLLMAVSYMPTAQLYGLAVWRGFLLPLTACLYNLMTLDSARKYYQGKGGEWKGRVQGGVTHD